MCWSAAIEPNFLGVMSVTPYGMQNNAPPHLKMSRPSFSEPMNMLAYTEKDLCNEIILDYPGGSNPIT